MEQQTRNFIRAFLQGLTGAGLFRKLDWPHAPSSDSSSTESQDVLPYEFSSSRIFWTAFLDGLTMRGLFECLTIPGAPTQIFAEGNRDEQSTVSKEKEGS